MAQRPDDRSGDPKMDPNSLYREEVITDRKIGTIRVLNPVKKDGAPDPSRPVLYIGEAQLATSVGTLPIIFPLDAQKLDEAVAQFADAAKVEIERTMKELQELRRQAASSIVVPQGGMGGLGGLPGGGMPGGGKIQIP